MILSDNEILDLMKESDERKRLVIKSESKINDIQIQPASVDFRLGDTFCIPKESSSGIIRSDAELDYTLIRSDRYLLLPCQFVLATTEEWIELPDNISAFVEGRSSMGRLGLFIQNAGWIDPGFKGRITLELFNANRFAIELLSGRRIGQFVFMKMGQSCSRPYNGKYQNQYDATGSRAYMDNDKPRDCKNSGKEII